MSARLARSAFQNAARRAQTTMASSAPRVSRRMASTSHGVAKSDTPWIVGSALVFGPAFLYLVSPSARKSDHHIEHKDKHEHPALLNDEHSKVLEESKENAEKPEPELMKDDEGTVADVASSVALSESSDSPNDAQPPKTHEGLKAAAESDASKEPEPASTEEKAASSDSDEKTGTFRAEGDSSPTEMGKARESAKEGVPPKKAAESQN